jgi:TonB family C-terminal domain
MSVSRTETVDFWKRHSFLVEVGLVLSLLFLVSAVQVEWTTTKDFDEPDPPPPETITVTEVTQTQQQRETPPPPAPTTSVVLPTNEIVEADEVEYDESLDVTPKQSAEEPPPPPDPGKKENRTEVFEVVEQSPSLIGGKKALYESVEYPSFARETGIEGRIVVQFVVDEEGNVQNPTILKSVHELLNEAALEAIKKQKFEPGRQRGRPVKVRMERTIVFQLR